MDDTTTTRELPTWVDRVTPRAGAKAQLYSAAIVWLGAAAVLLARGLVFASRAHWAVWILALAVVIGIAKGHTILYRAAERSTAHIRARGRACYFGFFSWASWAFVAVMMGGGIALRSLAEAHQDIPWVNPAMAVLYIAVATGLLYADRVYWLAALGRPEPAVD